MQRTIFALLLAAASQFANADEVAPPGYTAARQQFIAGAGGDATARDAAITAFQDLAARHPAHPAYLAYAGAATAMRGRDALMPWEKMKHAERGADMIDKALAQLTPEHDGKLLDGSPESIETRLVAATTLLSLPPFMNRRAPGKRALQAALQSPVLERAPAVVRARLFAAAAHVAAEDKRGEDEVAYLRQAVATGANTVQVAQAAARLKELGQ